MEDPEGWITFKILASVVRIDGLMLTIRSILTTRFTAPQFLIHSASAASQLLKWHALFVFGVLK